MLPLLLLGLLGLVVVSGAVSAGSSEPPPGWGVAIRVPGMATLNRGLAAVTSISCATAGNCAVGGDYRDGSHHHQAFVVDQTTGNWGRAIEVPGTGTLNHGDAYVTSVSCATAGNCAAGGLYTDGSHDEQAFVADETNGSWGNAIEVPGTATLNSGHQARVNSVSCATVGNCAAGGSYEDDVGDYHAFVVDETNGSWGNAVSLPGTANLISSVEAGVRSISCASPGNCAAGYSRGDVPRKAFVVDETNGSWGTGIEVPGTASLNVGGDAGVESVSCATPGNCALGGHYDDGSFPGPYQVFVADETNGSWGNAIEVPGTAKLNSGGGAFLTSVSCATAGNCAAGGWYESLGILSYVEGYTTPAHAFVVDETNGSWGKAIEVPGTGLKSGGMYSRGGFGKFGRAPFLVDETNGSWGPAFVVPGTASLDYGSSLYPSVNSVSCATAANCAAGGFYRHAAGAFVVSSTPPSSLNAGGTNCNGAYAGTGGHVVVPTGGSCTLAPGTNVAGNVTVSNGGTLYATGVEIGGVLKIAGTATVCQSNVLSDVKAVSAGAALTLGGRPGCLRGNTFLHDVVVKHDSHDVSIGDNTVAGNLIVLNDHGKREWIIGNTVANLLVAHSGPVVVRRNRAKGNLRCKANKPQFGSGNTAGDKNTCPK